MVALYSVFFSEFVRARVGSCGLTYHTAPLIHKTILFSKKLQFFKSVHVILASFLSFSLLVKMFSSFSC